MPRPPKKPPWSASLPLPEWAGGPPHVPPPPVPREPVRGLSTGHMGGGWRVRRTAADGSSELVTLAGEPWEGSASQAAQRAEVLGREDPDGKYVAEAVTAEPRAS